MCACAYLLCKAGCCGQQRAGVLAFPGSWGRRYPQPGSVNGSESTAQPCGKARHSQTQRCYIHTQKERKDNIFSMVSIMINYCWILHQTGELGRKKHDRANWKCQTQNRLITFSSLTFLPLFCCVCKSTKPNEKAIKEICAEMLFSDIKQTDHILSAVLF